MVIISRVVKGQVKAVPQSRFDILCLNDNLRTHKTEEGIQFMQATWDVEQF